MRSRRAPLSRAARLTKEWFSFWTAEDAPSFLPTAIQLAPTQSLQSWIIDPNVALSVLDEPTVLRTRVCVTPAFNGPAAGAGTFVSFGIRVTDSLPTSNTDFESSRIRGDLDWIWTTQYDYVSPQAAGGPNIAGRTSQDQWDDVKTKRRIEAGQGLALFVKNEDSSAGVITFTVDGRILYGH